MKFIDLTGLRFGRLVALNKTGGRRGGGTVWRLMCDCGKIVEVDAANLKTGRTKSCGCLQQEMLLAGTRSRHRKSKTTIHNIWCGMRQRCENPKAVAFSFYGARGIKVCERWQTFENFLEDMGECPEGMSIERIDNDGDYEPANCRWATKEDQVRNRRTSLLVEYQGRTVTLKELGQITGIPYKTIHHRYTIGKRGADLTAPLRKTVRRQK